MRDFGIISDKLSVQKAYITSEMISSHNYKNTKNNSNALIYM